MIPTSESPYQIIKGDALEVMRGLPDNSIHLIATDPPYYKVKDEQWDRQWETPEGFLSWMDELAQEWQRILKPNGSLYVFASPQMAYHVEGVIRKYFNVLNHIVWQKEGGTRANQADKEILRQYFGNSERVIFAEHFGSDNIAKGESGYQAQSEELRGFVFEPLRLKLANERDAAGLENSQINDAWCKYKSVNSTSQTQKWFSNSCFNPPTLEAVKFLQGLGMWKDKTAKEVSESLRQEFESLRQEFESLRQEFESLRRPFNSAPDVQFVDVWIYPTVQAYDGKHPCEKPAPMMEHIVSMSSNPDDIVLDCFMGSGATGAAAGKLGRKFIGVDSSEKYYRKAYQRIVTAYRHFEKLGDVGKLSASSFEGLPLFNNGGG